LTTHLKPIDPGPVNELKNKFYPPDTKPESLEASTDTQRCESSIVQKAERSWEVNYKFFDIVKFTVTNANPKTESIIQHVDIDVVQIDVNDRIVIRDTKRVVEGWGIKEDGKAKGIDVKTGNASEFWWPGVALTYVVMRCEVGVGTYNGLTINGARGTSGSGAKTSDDYTFDMWTGADADPLKIKWNGPTFKYNVIFTEDHDGNWELTNTATGKTAKGKAPYLKLKNQPGKNNSE
jgi:hypothetical protein